MRLARTCEGFVGCHAGSQELSRGVVASTIPLTTNKMKDYLLGTDQNALWPQSPVVQSALHALPEDKRVSFEEVFPENRGQAMELAVMEASAREVHAKEQLTGRRGSLPGSPAGSWVGSPGPGPRERRRSISHSLSPSPQQRTPGPPMPTTPGPPVPTTPRPLPATGLVGVPGTPSGTIRTLLQPPPTVLAAHPPLLPAAHPGTIRAVPQPSLAPGAFGPAPPVPQHWGLTPPSMLTRGLALAGPLVQPQAAPTPTHLLGRSPSPGPLVQPQAAPTPMHLLGRRPSRPECPQVPRTVRSMTPQRSSALDSSARASAISRVPMPCPHPLGAAATMPSPAPSLRDNRPPTPSKRTTTVVTTGPPRPQSLREMASPAVAFREMASPVTPQRQLLSPASTSRDVAGSPFVHYHYQPPAAASPGRAVARTPSLVSTRRDAEPAPAWRSALKRSASSPPTRMEVENDDRDEALLSQMQDAADHANILSELVWTQRSARIVGERARGRAGSLAQTPQRVFESEESFRKTVPEESSRVAAVRQELSRIEEGLRSLGVKARWHLHGTTEAQPDRRGSSAAAFLSEQPPMGPGSSAIELAARLGSASWPNADALYSLDVEGSVPGRAEVSLSSWARSTTPAPPPLASDTISVLRSANLPALNSREGRRLLEKAFPYQGGHLWQPPEWPEWPRRGDPRADEWPPELSRESLRDLKKVAKLQAILVALQSEVSKYHRHTQEVYESAAREAASPFSPGRTWEGTGGLGGVATRGAVRWPKVPKP